MSLPKSYSKEKMAEMLSDYVLKNPMKCLEQLSVKELEVLKEAVKAGADTHIVRPNRRFYDTMRQLLLVSTFHHKKERKLYFLLPDELRELFAPLLDKAIKEEKKREIARKKKEAEESLDSGLVGLHIKGILPFSRLVTQGETVPPRVPKPREIKASENTEKL